MLGLVTAQIIEQIEKMMFESGFEPLISLRLIGGRSIQVVVGLCYDRDDAGMDERASHCNAALRASLSHQGIYPYRLGLQDMDSLPMRDEKSEQVLRSLKALLDPRGILAPGRYIPS
jgi:4-cresol dehydrogenase (hydroxylating)